MRARFILSLAIFAPALQSCAVTQSQERAQQEARAEAAFRPYVGKTIADAVIAMGQPTTSFQIAQGKQAFQWVQTRARPGMIIPMGNNLIAAPPTQVECRVTLTATTASKSPSFGDWRVELVNVNGFC